MTLPLLPLIHYKLIKNTVLLYGLSSYHLAPFKDSFKDSNASYFMCYHNYNKNHFLCVAFQATRKGRRISPTSSQLSGFIFPYLRYFLMCRFLLHLIHTSSLKCICIILILLWFSNHWRVYNLCFHWLSFCPLRFAPISLIFPVTYVISPI